MSEFHVWKKGTKWGTYMFIVLPERQFKTVLSCLSKKTINLYVPHFVLFFQTWNELNNFGHSMYTRFISLKKCNADTICQLHITLPEYITSGLWTHLKHTLTGSYESNDLFSNAFSRRIPHISWHYSQSDQNSGGIILGRNVRSFSTRRPLNVADEWYMCGQCIYRNA